MNYNIHICNQNIFMSLIINKAGELGGPLFISMSIYALMDLNQ